MKAINRLDKLFKERQWNLTAIEAFIFRLSEIQRLVDNFCKAYQLESIDMSGILTSAGDAWYVMSTHYDDGSKSAIVAHEQEFYDNIPKSGRYKNYMLYVTKFNTLEEAEKFKREVLGE